MRVLRSVVVGACLGWAFWTGAQGLRAQGPPAPVSNTEPDATIHSRTELAGRWTYNPDESVIAATGRPERAPRSATAGANNGSGAPPSTSSSTGQGRAGGRGGSGARGGQPAGTDTTASAPAGSYSTYDPTETTAEALEAGPTYQMIQESRDLSRDLLEVPEVLMITVDRAAVTFVDELAHTLTYPTDGRKQHYHLAASDYQAAVTWDGQQLKEHIEGVFGFKMTEVLFLSPDAQRLFVVIRVGQPRKNAPVVGVNRVYDRADP